MEQKHKLAIIGRESTTLIFKALGVNTVPVGSGEEAREKLETLADTLLPGEAQLPEYAVVFVEEEFYKLLPEELILKLSKRSLPAVVPLPSANSKDPKFAVNRLSKFVERAVGSDIFS